MPTSLVAAILYSRLTEALVCVLFALAPSGYENRHFRERDLCAVPQVELRQVISLDSGFQNSRQCHSMSVSGQALIVFGQESNVTPGILWHLDHVWGVVLIALFHPLLADYFV